MRINVGCGTWPLPGWVNLDLSTNSYANVRADGTKLPFHDGSLDEVYAGHFVEHLERSEALSFLAECRRCLKPGGKLGVVVPDTRAIVTKYLSGDASPIEYPVGQWQSLNDLDSVCSWFFYSTLQESRHRWSYDTETLARLLREGGFTPEREINRWFDPRIAVGAWYQCGWEAA